MRIILQLHKQGTMLKLHIYVLFIRRLECLFYCDTRFAFIFLIFKQIVKFQPIT